MLHKTFDFWETDESIYLNSELHRLLKRIDFMFNGYLREILHLNANSFLEFIKKFTVSKGMQ